MHLYPLIFRPIYKEKVWGGRRLELLGRELPGGPDTPIGESWEIADLGATSPSGGGGDEARSVVANGPLAGRTLSELMAGHARDLLGRTTAARDGAFPLLIKYLDARKNLSVQVHPSPAYAQAHPGAHLKTEAWYVVHAEPGSVIYKGVRPGVGRDDLVSALASGGVPDLLLSYPAVPGEAHFLPSGTCHALGAGILVAEVQTPSDTTFRLYDWGRTDRELHVDQALECIDFGATRDATITPPTGGDENTRRTLVSSPYFSIDERRSGSGAGWPIEAGVLRVLMVVSGGVVLRSTAATFDPVPAGAGDTVLVPAGLAPTVVEATEPGVVLDIGVPAR